MAYRGGNVALSTAYVTSIAVDVSGIGIQAGDIILLAANNGNSGAKTFPAGFATISGLTQLHPIWTEGGAYADVRYKVADGSETTTLTVSGPNTPWNLLARVYSGRATSPFAVAAVQTAVSAGTTSPCTLSFTGLTANPRDDLVLIAPMGLTPTGGTYGFTQPTGFANSRLDKNTTDYTPVACSCDKLTVVPGATGTLTGTFTSVGSGQTTGYGGWLISLASGSPKLVGWDGTGYTLVSAGAQNANGSACCFASGYPGTPGTIDTAWFYCGAVATNPATYVKLVLFDAGGAQVAVSNPLTLVANSFQSATLAGSGSASVISQNYTIVIVPDTGYFNGGTYSGSSSFVDNQFTKQHFDYTTPPANLPAADVTNIGPQLVAFFTGPAGSTSVDPGIFLRRGGGFLSPTRGFGRLI